MVKVQIPSMIQRRRRIPDILRAAYVTKVSMVLNFLLTGFKFAAGILGNSSAMVADAAHSLSDFITDIAVIVGLKVAKKPRDSTHNYGHGKIETLAAAFTGLVLVAAAFGIFWGGLQKIIAFYQWRGCCQSQAKSLLLQQSSQLC